MASRLQHRPAPKPRSFTERQERRDAQCDGPGYSGLHAALKEVRPRGVQLPLDLCLIAPDLGPDQLASLTIEVDASGQRSELRNELAKCITKSFEDLFVLEFIFDDLGFTLLFE
jgi:hypothetical protein